jgi:hypothetical protein
MITDVTDDTPLRLSDAAKLTHVSGRAAEFFSRFAPGWGLGSTNLLGRL